MPTRTRSRLYATFLVLVVSIAGATFYTEFVYYDIYKATHSLNMTTDRFDMTANSTHVKTETTITIYNPSDQTFEVIYIEERLTTGLGGFISINRIWFSIPKPIEPFSNLTVTLRHEAPIQRLAQEGIYGSFRIFLDGPIVGEFMLNSYERLS